MNVLISQYISPENEDMYRLMDIHFFYSHSIVAGGFDEIS